jgi:hypothetical protein
MLWGFPGAERWLSYWFEKRYQSSLTETAWFLQTIQKRALNELVSIFIVKYPHDQKKKLFESGNSISSILGVSTV